MTTVRGRACSGAVAALVVAGVVAAVPAAPALADAGGVVISELNYHAGTDLDSDDWLELTNTGTPRSTWAAGRFTAGVTAVLPAGCVVPAGGCFVGRQGRRPVPGALRVRPAAVYSGNLSNGGETVTLVDGARGRGGHGDLRRRRALAVRP